MVYLPREVRRAMGVMAASRGCRISDVYAEAASQYLRSHGDDGEAAKPEPAVTRAECVASAAQREGIDRILNRLDGYGRMLVDIHAQTVDLVPIVETRPLAVVIAALTKAGSAGLGTGEVRALMTGEGFHALKTTTVRDALVQAGVARHQEGRWYIREVSPSGD